MKTPLKYLLAPLAIMLLAAGSARATIIISASEVGGNVVFTFAGGLDLSSMTATNFTLSPSFNSTINPSLNGIQFWTTPATFREYLLPNFSAPANYGAGGNHSPSAVSSAFPGFIFGGTGGFFYLPTTYVSSDPFSATMTFAGSTFASLGVTPGMYTWLWSNGGTSDSLILNIGQSGSVPDTGSTLAMLALGLGGVLALRVFGVQRAVSRVA